jgi:hypothetical protein
VLDSGMADLRCVVAQVEPEAALAYGQLTRVGTGGQPTHRKALCLGHQV